ncbi:MAG: lamin tail domain-containing protein [Candidatus Paceibacterota bacterium]
MKNMVRVLSLLSLFLLANAAQAAVVFNEVQISPTESRFIELYNNGSEPVDLTGYYIQRKTETGSSFSSLVTSTNFAGKQIGAGKFFVISRTNVPNIDLVVGSMTLSESNTIQLKNTSGDVVDKLCWGAAGDCTGAKLAPNPAEGKSISLINSAFVESSPTLGAANTAATNTNTNTDNNVATSTESSSPENNNSSGSSKEPSLKLTYTEPLLTGIPIMFNVASFGAAGDQHIYGTYVWNFGDGATLESRASDTGDIAHTYFYPGDYILTLEYYGGNYSINPSLTIRKTLTILPVSLFISKVGSAEDFFVELSNQTKSEVDVSGWRLVHGNEVFTLPKNTFLPAGKKVTFSPNITQFHFNNVDSVLLYNKNKDMVFDSASLSPKKVAVSSSVTRPVNISPSVATYARKVNDVTDLTSEKMQQSNINSEDLLAKPKEYNMNALKIALILILLILCGSILVYLIRKNSRKINQNTNFEILDE